MHPYVARIGAEAVANIPTQVHEPGASLVGAGPGASSAHMQGLLAPTGGSGGSTGCLYQLIKVGNPLAHILLFMRRAQKGPQLGPRAHFVRCTDLADTPDT